MSATMTANAASEEFRELRKELSIIKTLLASSPSKSSSSVFKANVHVENCGGERKPFLITIKSSSEKRIRISATRTAITISLLIDLTQRTQGISRDSSLRDLALSVLRIIAPEIDESPKVLEQLRVGLYRYSQFWQEELGDLLPANYDTFSERLMPTQPGLVFDIDIVSSDSALEQALPSLGRPPTLERLKRERFLFVPSGGAGSDRLLNEIYSSSGDLNVRLAYARPQLITVPPKLIEKYALNPHAKSRYHQMHKRLSEGTLSFTEIVPEESINQIITPDLNGRYPYFDGLSALEVMEHLKFLEQLLLTEPRYKLILTRAEIPFFLGTYCSSLMNLSIFFKNAPSGPQSGFSSFAIWGEELAAMTQETVFEWLLNHETTTIDRFEVIAKVRMALHEICTAYKQSN